MADSIARHTRVPERCNGVGTTVPSAMRCNQSVAGALNVDLATAFDRLKIDMDSCQRRCDALKKENARLRSDVRHNASTATSRQKAHTQQTPNELGGNTSKTLQTGTRHSRGVGVASVSPTRTLLEKIKRRQAGQTTVQPRRMVVLPVPNPQRRSDLLSDTIHGRRVASD
eukprot:m.231043 g.231043  ORF g.231043 m.231043 type:complete len:170 (+) comp19264_c0_seq4:2041-2550(+)